MSIDSLQLLHRIQKISTFPTDADTYHVVLYVRACEGKLGCRLCLHSLHHQKDLTRFALLPKDCGDHSIDRNDTLPSLPYDLSHLASPFSSTLTPHGKQPTKPV